MKRNTRTMSMAQDRSRIQENVGEDKKPTIDFVYRSSASSESGRFSSSQSFRSMPERTAGGKLFGTESDLARLNNIKKEDDKSHKWNQCLCEIESRLSKH